MTLDSGNPDITEEGSSRTIQALDSTIHFHDVGDGSPIVLLQFWGPGTTAWLSWHRVLPRLAGDYRCLAVDSPNFAKSGPLFTDMPVHRMQAEAAIAVMDSEGIERAHIIGASQGAQSALLLAALYPDRVDRLVVGGGHMASGGGDYLVGNGEEEGVRVGYRAMMDPTPSNMKSWVELCVRDRSMATSEIVDYLVHHHTARSDLVPARESMSYFPLRDLTGDLLQLKSPTAIIWGRADRTTGIEIGLRMLNLIEGSRLLIIREAGHWVPFERPDEYSDYVTAFLGSSWA
jgi:2-hydroxy-6-oxonona-2,4-dienedioate hydrolase